MLRLARLSIARPRASLAVWAAIAIALSVIGFGVEDSLSPSKPVVAGTESARALNLAEEHFGPTQLVPVLLEGPKSEIDRQGPILVRALAERSDTRVMSPWDGGPLSGELRPRPDAARIIAAVSRTDQYMYDSGQEQIQQLVDRTTTYPVRPYVSGTPALERGLAEASTDTARTAGLIATAILFVVLLVLLRAVVAAAVIATFAAVTSLVGFGAMALVAEVEPVAPVAVPLGSMAGLALGVGYAMLVYRRWAEAQANGASSADASTAAVGGSGRAVLIGGTALVVALVLAALVGPTENIAAEGIGVVLCALLGIGAAVVVMPAALELLGSRIHWLRFPPPAFVVAGWNRLVGAGNSVVRHALAMGALAAAVLGVLAFPVLSLEVGPPSPLRLPERNAARVAYQEVSDVMGPGWVAPYSIVAVAKDRPVTDRALLREFDRLQNAIEKDPRVEVVAGPGDLYATSRELKALPKQLNRSKKMLKTAPAGLKELEKGLGQAGSGSVQMQSGLASAAAGAQLLASGAGRASSGSAQLHAGLAAAQAGAAKISSGLGAALTGARTLQSGAGQLEGGTAAALGGAKQIAGGLGEALSKVRPGVPIVKAMAADVSAGASSVKSAAASATTTAAAINTAATRLKAMKTGTDDPAYQAALTALGQASTSAAATSSSIGAAADKLGGATVVSGAFADQVAELSGGLERLYGGSQALSSGIAKLNAGAGRLQAGQGELVTGMGQLTSGSGSLTAGLSKLSAGAGQLESGLNQLSGGSGELAAGLGAAPGKLDPLIGGLDEMQVAVAKFRGELPSPKDIARLQKQSPGLFESGYFTLAAISGAPPADRMQASFAVNVDGGGSAGQIMIVPKYGSGSPQLAALGDDLRAMTDRFAQRTDTEAAVGGQAAQFGDFESAGAERIWPVIGVVGAAVALLLAAMLRTVILPLVAVALAGFATAVGFAVLEVLFGGDDPLLGGPGSFSPVSVIGIFAAAFGIATVLEVVLLQRTREEYVATGDARVALERGLRETAPAVTGAAVAMAAAAVPFMITGFLTVAQFAIGIGVVILVDALIIRPVLLPAAAAWFGRPAWWPTRGHVTPA